MSAGTDRFDYLNGKHPARSADAAADETLESLLEQRARIWENAEEIRARMLANPTPADERALRQALDDVEWLTTKVVRAETDRRKAAADFLPANGAASARLGPGRAPVPAERAEYDRPLPDGASFRELVERDAPADMRDLSLGKALRGIVTGKWDNAEREHRAMSGATSGAGGALLPSIMLGQVVDLARNATQVIRAGARVVPMSNRNVIMPRWVTDPTVAWRSENAAIQNSDGAVDKITFNAQVLAGSTTISREIIEDTDLSGLLENAYAAAVAQAWDRAALLGAGPYPEPTGLKASAAVTDKSALGTNGVAFVWSHLIDAAASVRARNEAARGAIMAPRSQASLGKLTGTDGHYLEKPPYLADLAMYETGQLPVNETCGTANNASTLFVGDFSQLFLGVRAEFRVDVFPQVGAANGQVLLVAWFRGDVQVGRGSAFAVRTGLLP